MHSKKTKAFDVRIHACGCAHELASARGSGQNADAELSNESMLWYYIPSVIEIFKGVTCSFVLKQWFMPRHGIKNAWHLHFCLNFLLYLWELCSFIFYSCILFQEWVYFYRFLSHENKSFSFASAQRSLSLFLLFLPVRRGLRPLQIWWFF